VLQVLHLGGRRADGEGVTPAASLHRHPFHGVLPAGTPTRVNQRASARSRAREMRKGASRFSLRISPITAQTEFCTRDRSPNFANSRQLPSTIFHLTVVSAHYTRDENFTLNIGGNNC
jgi:hypothetical protein